VLVLGSLLALVSGMLNAAAAALEKHQGMRTAPEHAGLRLLAALARRPLWVLAMGLSALAWACEAAALASAPVPVAATLRNAGRGLLVLGGGRWLEESFTRLEIVGVALASAGGAATAVAASSTKVVLRPLSNLTELAAGAACAVVAAAVARTAAWLARSSGPGAGPGVPGARRTRADGVAMGTAVGVIYAGTGIFTKEIGDRFALYGARGLPLVAASLAPWLMVAMAVWAQGLIQEGFRRANAATVSAANASVASLGLIAAGFLLYGEPLPGGLDRWLLVVGMVGAIGGTVLLVGARPSSEPAQPAAAPAPGA
jgi:hypothetical protein